MTEATATNSTMSPEALAAETKPAVKAKRWYIIHAHSGFEKKVAQAILETAAQKGLSEAFEQVVVPTKNVVEVRRGKKTATERKFFPGYVLAKMDMTDATWQIVKTTPKVTGFLGGKGIRPQPITEKEALTIFNAVEEGASSPRHTIHYDIGENVMVDTIVSLRVGQLTLPTSVRTSRMNFAGFIAIVKRLFADFQIQKCTPFRGVCGAAYNGIFNAWQAEVLRLFVFCRCYWGNRQYSHGSI